MSNSLGAFASIDDLGVTINNLEQAIKKTEEPYVSFMIDALNKLIEAHNILLDLVEKYPDLEVEPNEFPFLGGL